MGRIGEALATGAVVLYVTGAVIILGIAAHIVVRRRRGLSAGMAITSLVLAAVLMFRGWAEDANHIRLDSDRTGVVFAIAGLLAVPALLRAAFFGGGRPINDKRRKPNPNLYLTNLPHGRVQEDYEIVEVDGERRLICRFPPRHEELPDTFRGGAPKSDALENQSDNMTSAPDYAYSVVISPQGRVTEKEEMNLGGESHTSAPGSMPVTDPPKSGGRLATTKLVLEVLTMLVGLIGAALALLGLSR